MRLVLIAAACAIAQPVSFAQTATKPPDLTGVWGVYRGRGAGPIRNWRLRRQIRCC